jgi:hypothetical protein
VTNTKSLYSTVIYGKGITDDSRFIDHALGGLSEFMAADGQAIIYRRFISPAAGTVEFAKALNRRTISFFWQQFISSKVSFRRSTLGSSSTKLHSRRWIQQPSRGVQGDGDDQATESISGISFVSQELATAVGTFDAAAN